MTHGDARGSQACVQRGSLVQKPAHDLGLAAREVVLSDGHPADGVLLIAVHHRVGFLQMMNNSTRLAKFDKLSYDEMRELPL